jgi:P-type Cu2+ transporter
MERTGAAHSPLHVQSRDTHHKPGEGHDHAHMVADFRRRFCVSLALTVPVLALSPELWELFGRSPLVAFAGDRFVLFTLATAIYFHGGWPFLKGLFAESRKRQPGMMTLIAVAISAAYFYSSAVVFGLAGMGFYWELATLIVIMLLGHWIEMRSVMGASGALEALVKLLPAVAHRVMPGGSTSDVAVSAIKPGDRVLVKPGERVPTDGVIMAGLFA